MLFRMQGALGLWQRPRLHRHPSFGPHLLCPRPSSHRCHVPCVHPLSGVTELSEVTCYGLPIGESELGPDW